MFERMTRTSDVNFTPQRREGCLPGASLFAVLLVLSIRLLKLRSTDPTDCQPGRQP